MTRGSFALFALLLAAGCGEIKTLSADAGTGGGNDAAGEADAGNPADPLQGNWTWWIGDAETPDSRCDVTIGAGTYQVYCPQDPYEVVPDCMKTKNDTRIEGTWDSAFAGAFDEIERYEGIGCAEAGYSPVGVDIVSEDVLVMDASHTAPSEETGFLELALGGWDWSIHDTGDEALGCQVSFEPGEDTSTVAFRVECPQEPTTPIANCTETDFLVISGTLSASLMEGEGWDEAHYEGSGCAPMYPDPVVEDTHTPMGATRN